MSIDYVRNLPVKIAGEVEQIPTAADLPPTTLVPEGSIRYTEDSDTLYLNTSSGWKTIPFSSGVVTSVNGQTGVVLLDTDDIPEGALNLYFTEERAQDAVGNILVDSGRIDFTYNDGAPSITADLIAGSITNTYLAVGAVTDDKGSLANKPAITVVATTNQTLSGLPTIDGFTVSATSTVLLTAQSAPAENGPWRPAAGAWSRPNWYVSGNTTQAFQFITTLVRLGTIYQGSTWRMTTAGTITIDTTATTWVVTPLAVNASTVTGYIPYTVTTVATTTAAVAGTLYLCNTTSGTFTVTLPAPVTGQFIMIKDKLGTFGTNKLTIARNASEKIEGLSASYDAVANFSSLLIVSDGTDWYFV